MYRHERTARLTSLVFALGLFIGPGVVHALGLGNFILRSGLDEPLVAEIEITSGSADDLRSLKAGLASRAAFDAAGIDRPAHLSLIKYVVAERVDGSPILKLTTDEPIREPFLHLLLQIEWSGGRLVREFTTLLDPPHLASADGTQVSPPIIPQEQIPVEPVLPPAAEPIGEMPSPEIAVETPALAVPAPLAAAPSAGSNLEQPATEQPVERPIENASSGDAVPTEIVASPGPDNDAVAQMDPDRLLGPDVDIPPEAPTSDWASVAEYRVKRGDTLSRITTELRRDTSLSAEQVMLALLKTNKAAFFGNNVNNLKSGKILKIPSREEVESIPRTKAIKEFRAQYNSWQEYKLKLAGTAQVVNVANAAKADKGASRGEIAPQSGQTATDAGNTDLLKIVRAENDKSSAKGAAGEGNAISAEERQRLIDRAATLEEAITSKELENKELRERVSQLEAQIKNATRLIEIENQALAKAQKEAQEAKAAPEPAKPAVAIEAPVAPVTVAEPGASVAPTPAANSEQAPPVTAAPSQELPPPVVSAAEGQPAVSEAPEVAEPEESLVDTVMAAIGSAIAMVTGGDDASSGDAPIETESVGETEGENELLIPLAGGVLILCLGILAVYRRRRSKSMAEFGESILSGGLNMNSEGSTGIDGEKSADVSFLSDFSQGGMGNIHTDEVDPIAEAEVYLAYGRDEQAEEILRDAVVKDPGRHELRLKLMEIYQQRKDLQAFETVAEELYAALEGKGGKVWDKAEEMGYKMNPANPLFRGGANPRSPSGATTLEADGLMLQGAVPAAGDALIDLDLGQAQPTPSEPPSVPAHPEESFSLDLDFTAGNSASAGGAPEAPSIAFESFSQPDSSAGAEEPEAAVESAGGIDFDFSALSATSEPQSGAGSSESSSEFDISFESAPEVAFESAPAASSDVDMGLGDLAFENDATGIDVASDDEIATKLDLAKAYIDMGDADGARSILDEVLAEGSDAQKKQAADLASQIAA